MPPALGPLYVPLLKPQAQQIVEVCNVITIDAMGSFAQKRDELRECWILLIEVRRAFPVRDVTSCNYKYCMQRSFHRRWGEWCDARGFHKSIERIVITSKLLVV